MCVDLLKVLWKLLDVSEGFWRCLMVFVFCVFDVVFKVFGGVWRCFGVLYRFLEVSRRLCRFWRFLKVCGSFGGF